MTLFRSITNPARKISDTKVAAEAVRAGERSATVRSKEMFRQLWVPYPAGGHPTEPSAEKANALAHLPGLPVRPRSLPGNQPLLRENPRRRWASEGVGRAAEPLLVLREDALLRGKQRRRRRTGFLPHLSEPFGKRRNPSCDFCRPAQC